MRLDATKLQQTSIGQAFQAFPKPIFTAWLRFRQQAADRHVPNWRNEGRTLRRIFALDVSAAAEAVKN